MNTDTQPIVLHYKKQELTLYPPIKSDTGEWFRPWWDSEQFDTETNSRLWEDAVEEMLPDADGYRGHCFVMGWCLESVNEALKENGLEHLMVTPRKPDTRTLEEVLREFPQQ